MGTAAFLNILALKPRFARAKGQEPSTIVWIDSVQRHPRVSAFTGVLRLGIRPSASPIYSIDVHMSRLADLLGLELAFDPRPTRYEMCKVGITLSRAGCTLPAPHGRTEGQPPTAIRLSAG